jgi:hypothetical protein
MRLATRDCGSGAVDNERILTSTGDFWENGMDIYEL